MQHRRFGILQYLDGRNLPGQRLLRHRIVVHAAHIYFADAFRQICCGNHRAVDRCGFSFPFVQPVIRRYRDPGLFIKAVLDKPNVKIAAQSLFDVPANDSRIPDGEQRFLAHRVVLVAAIYG